MFVFDVLTGRITLHAGDTGSVTYHINGDTLGTDDRVLWTMVDPNGKVAKQNILSANASNDVTVDFLNSDTDNLSAATYRYDMRVVVNPQYETIDGVQKIVDGDNITTLTDPISVTIKGTIGKI